mmetsp:Transcript_33511/g.51484  ORF Transcript_33511/g.51484 Transcript_33511/m.51484 type:complete len:253 (+) Transcript_33511:527-1285(+)
MLVPETFLLELSLVVLVVNIFEDVLEPAIVTLHDGVLGAHVNGVVALEAVPEASVGESGDRRIGVVHAHQHSGSLELEHFDLGLGGSAVGLEDHGEFSGLAGHEVLGSVLVAKGVSANDNGLGPSRHKSGDVVNDNGLSEHGSVELVSDGSVGALPHLLEAEFLDTGLIGSNGGALNADLVLLDGVGSVEGDLIVGLVSLLDAQVEVLDIDVEVGVDESVLDLLPNDSRHFIAVHLNDGVRNLDLLHFQIFF